MEMKIKTMYFLFWPFNFTNVLLRMPNILSIHVELLICYNFLLSSSQFFDVKVRIDRCLYFNHAVEFGVVHIGFILKLENLENRPFL